MKEAGVLARGSDPKPYLSTQELSEFTPWSEQAIRTMISRGVLKLGVHYFKPRGLNGRPIFSWLAIVNYIEGSIEPQHFQDAVPFANGAVIGLDATEKTAYRLLG